MASPVAIGFAGPLSGPQEIVGTPMGRAAALAVEHYNARRPAHEHVEFVAVDDGADAAMARAATAQVLASARVVGLVGHKNSDCCAAAGPLYAAAHLAHISP